MTRLHELLENSARRFPERIAVEDSERGTITYQDLNRNTDRLWAALLRGGVQPGDRVGIYGRKSIATVTAIFGILKAGAAYVPVDPGAPSQRVAYIFTNCAVRAIVMEKCLLENFGKEFGGGKLAVIAEIGADFLLIQVPTAVEPASAATTSADGLAYLLYTSGSTGHPKGVMLSHRAALSFVDWCSETFSPTEQDRFSSHSPFHFDLSILDLYVSLKHGGMLVLIGEELGKQPGALAPFIAERRLTIWYSTPSILRLLIQFGKMERFDLSTLRLVLFAGEVFPVKYLRELKRLLPRPACFNLYGPTETNVCTYCEIPAEIPAERTEPFPIGKVCSNDRAMVVNRESGRPVPAGEEGELLITGGSVMQGYWNLPDQNANAFITDDAGARWYKTGDLVKEAADGNYIFLGRRDRMVKRRSYRVELGEIEAALYRHPTVMEAAAIALPDEESGVQIKVFLSCRDGQKLSLIELKKFCAANLPVYMVPDRFSFLPELPKTSTDKLDYQKLKELT